MSIHKISAGKYQVRWRDKGRQCARTFRKKSDAEKFEAIRLLGQLLGFLREQDKDEELDITFKELSEIWMRDHAEVHKAPSSIIRDKQTLRDYILPFLGKLRLSAITKRDLVKIQATLRKEGRLNPKTINNVTSLCHKIFADGMSWGFLTINPVAGIQRIRCPDIEHRFWTFDERDRYLNFARSRNPELYEIVAFAVHTGLRRGEVEGLLRDCVDFERREIIVKRNFCHKTSQLNNYTKGKNIRRVPMNEVVYDLVKKHRLLAPNQPIFRKDFEHLVWRHFKPMQNEAGVSVITFHDLRHTFASHLAMSGVSLFDIQKLLGHSDIKTTMRYMHLAPDHLKGVTDVLVRGRERFPTFASLTGNDTTQNEGEILHKAAHGLQPL